MPNELKLIGMNDVEYTLHPGDIVIYNFYGSDLFWKIIRINKVTIRMMKLKTNELSKTPAWDLIKYPDGYPTCPWCISVTTDGYYDIEHPNSIKVTICDYLGRLLKICDEGYIHRYTYTPHDN